ncbi:hypothetical protein ACVTTK_05435 [Alcaligenes nematophilus]
MSTQFINDAMNNPLFAIIPIDLYRQLQQQGADLDPAPRPSLLSEDGRFVTLPYGGPDARIDVALFICLWHRQGLWQMPINKRAHKYSDFPENRTMTLDPVIRRVFLNPGSAYVNTMQASDDVVEALVETGAFKRVKVANPSFSRPVDGIEIIASGADKFLEQHGRPNTGGIFDLFLSTKLPPHPNHSN